MKSNLVLSMSVETQLGANASSPTATGSLHTVSEGEVCKSK